MRECLATRRNSFVRIDLRVCCPFHSLIATLPEQPPAGKIEYHLELMAGGNPIDLHDENNVVIRFRGDVPAWALKAIEERY